MSTPQTHMQHTTLILFSVSLAIFTLPVVL